MIKGENYKQGESVRYRKGDYDEIVKIKEVHLDDMPYLYFTIVLADGTEKQTIPKYMTPLPPDAAHKSNGSGEERESKEARSPSPQSSSPKKSRHHHSARFPGLELSIWNAERIKQLNRAGYRHFSEDINALGTQSGIAQHLTGPITSVEKMLQYPDHVLLVARDSSGVMVGYLKYGHKDLFFYNKKGKVKEYPSTLCLLDFYVMHSIQRQGCGIMLFKEFLAQAEIEFNRTARAGGVTFGPHLFAYDRPSPKLLAFMKKHYGLNKPDLQPNKYTIFEGFPLPR